ncbi:MAG: hypothetical protein FWC50_07375 [Planctomycetaceae bacterium]|nr:hypothetical protein [Planctomycetaceae bacterium]
MKRVGSFFSFFTDKNLIWPEGATYTGIALQEAPVLRIGFTQCKKPVKVSETFIENGKKKTTVKTVYTSQEIPESLKNLTATLNLDEKTKTLAIEIPKNDVWDAVRIVKSEKRKVKSFHSHRDRMNHSSIRIFRYHVSLGGPA